MSMEQPETRAEPAALSDDEVVSRVRGGEPALFEILMRRYNQRIYRVIRSVLRNEDEAEDVMQQAYLSAFTHLDQFVGASSFATWLTRIALNEAFARIRKQKRFVDVEAQEEPTPMDRTPEARAQSRELAALLESAVETLPDLYRTVFMLREVEELSTQEAAACLEVSEEVIKVRLHRARGLLRERLYEQVGGSVSDAFSFLRPRCDRVVAKVLSQITR
jgi:RNA polymerase sigma-70 factor, ECF subfamily